MLQTVENSIYDCLDTGLPQQIEVDTNEGRILIIVAKIKLDEEDVENESIM